MTKNILKPIKVWREAATLIIASRTKDVSNGFNYKVLSMKRSEHTAFMKNNLAFPGGGLEKQDETLEWLKYFENIGVSKKLEELNVSKHPAMILQNVEGQLQRFISLRLAAIRETFEEVGILICKRSKAPSDTSGFFRNLDVKHYQNLIHDHKMTFLDMCKELEIIPDLWSLREWSNWLTPTFYGKRRYDTMFYIITLQEQPPANPETNEAYSYMWRTPTEYLEMSKEEIFLPPPQFYEFSRLRNIKDIDALKTFAINREPEGLALHMPVQYRCSDGIALVLPGDDAYPKNVNYNETPEEADRSTEKSVEEFNKTQNLHRTIVRGPNDIKILMTINPTNGHFSVNLNNSQL